MELNETERVAIDALAALKYLTGHDRQAYVTCAEIAKECGTTPQFLAQIMHKLARAGLCVSRVGRHGGFNIGNGGNASVLTILQYIGSNCEIEPKGYASNYAQSEINRFIDKLHAF